MKHSIDNFLTTMKVENLLMRKLKADEEEYLKDHTIDEFISDKLEMEESDVKGLRRIKEIISAYCTLNEDEYQEVLKKGDVMLPYYVFKSILNDLEIEMKSGDECPKTELITDRAKDIMNKSAEVVKNLVDLEPNWLQTYSNLDPNMSIIADMVSDYLDQKEQENFDIFCKKVFRSIKNKVVEELATYLKDHKDESFEYDDEICDAIANYLFKTEDNISIYIKDGSITVH